MAHRTLIAVFASQEEAADARGVLLGEGFGCRDVALSIRLTNDPLAAEALGQAYANQTSSPRGDLVQSIAVAFFGKSDDDSTAAARMADVQRRTGPHPRRKRSTRKARGPFESRSSYLPAVHYDDAHSGGTDQVCRLDSPEAYRVKV
jgi:hypothetical protein